MELKVTWFPAEQVKEKKCTAKQSIHVVLVVLGGFELINYSENQTKVFSCNILKGKSHLILSILTVKAF